MAIITKTVKSSGGDYSLFSTWESTEQTDLVTDGDSHVVECDAFELTNDGTVIDGWVTGASNTLTIQAASGHEHGGVFGAGFILGSTSAYVEAIDLRINYVTIKEIELKRTGSGEVFMCVVAPANFQIVLDSVLGSGGTASDSVFRGKRTIYRNCVAKNTTGTGFSTSESYYGCIYQNCTAIDCLNGFKGAFGGDTDNEADRIQNCVAFGNTTDFASGTYRTGAGGCLTNASGDTSAPGSSPVTSITSAAFVDYAGGDFTPAASGALDGAGTDLSGTFTNDVTGATRSTWDIGAYIAASGGGGFKASWAIGSNQIIQGVSS